MAGADGGMLIGGSVAFPLGAVLTVIRERADAKIRRPAWALAEADAGILTVNSEASPVGAVWTEIAGIALAGVLSNTYAIARTFIYAGAVERVCSADQDRQKHHGRIKSYSSGCADSSHFYHLHKQCQRGLLPENAIGIGLRNSVPRFPCILSISNSLRECNPIVRFMADPQPCLYHINRIIELVGLEVAVYLGHVDAATCSLPY